MFIPAFATYDIVTPLTSGESQSEFMKMYI